MDAKNAGNLAAHDEGDTDGRRNLVPLCQTCQGEGFHWEWEWYSGMDINPDAPYGPPIQVQREREVQVTCPDCGGTGKEARADD